MRVGVCMCVDDSVHIELEEERYDGKVLQYPKWFSLFGEVKAMGKFKHKAT